MPKQHLAVQVHIPPYDSMGGTHDWEKVRLISIGLKHLRFKNPTAHIAFSGHGLRPSKEALDCCDFVYWENVCNPIAGTGQMPAQYPYVHKAIRNCINSGAEKVLKLRGDGLYFIEDFYVHCDKILKTEKKDLLITQMTGWEQKKMGDCIMFCHSDLMDYIWHEKHPIHFPDGLVQIGTNFANYYATEELEWNTLLRKKCSFRNIKTLKWMDLRWNYHHLKHSLAIFEEQLFADTFNFEPFLWGATNGWHRFDENNNMTFSIEKYFYEEKTFYANH